MSVLYIRNGIGDFVPIYTIKGEKGDKGDAGSVTAVNGISPDGSGNVKLGAVHPRNLLDNSDFRHPVNQRGNAVYNGNSAYTVDRWVLWSSDGNGSCAVEDGHLAISPNSGAIVSLAQRFEKGYLDPDKTYTLAYLTSAGKIEYYQNAAIRLDAFDYVQITADAWKGIVWAALYEGDYNASNLPPYVPKGYAAELAECMRYYVYIGGYRWVHGLGLYGMGIEVPVFNPVPMRVCPTVSYSSDLAFFDGSNGWISVGDANATQYTDRCSSFFIQLNTDLPETSTSKVFIVRGIESLSADL